MRSILGALASTVQDKAPVPFAPRRAPNLLPSGLFGRGNKQTRELESIGSVGTLFAIVNALSESTSTSEWKLYRKTVDGRRRYASGQEEPRVEVTRHLALRIWNRPNPFFTRNLFVESFQQHLDLTGEAYWLVGRDPRANFPMELWPVRPDRMTPVPHPTDFLAGWVYTGPEGEKVPLGVDEVIQLKLPHPTDPYRGMGAVQSILADLDSVHYSAEWNRNFFVNGAEPGGIIQVPDDLGDQEYQELVARWNEQHRGVSNAHRVAVLDKSAVWTERKMTQKDMQFAELRNVSREVIREAFRFPKPMLGTVEDVNRANAEAGEVVHARWLVTPRLERIKQALNTVYLPMFGAADVEFDYCNPVPPDRFADNAERASRTTAYKTLVDAGVDPEDAAMVAGLPPMRTNAAPEPPVPVPAGAA